MTCQDYAALMDVYLDGECGVAEKLTLETHCDQCINCKTALATLQTEREQWRTEFRKGEVTPARISTAVMERIAMEKQPSVVRPNVKETSKGKQQWLGYALCLLFGFWLAWFLRPQVGSIQPSQPALQAKKDEPKALDVAVLTLGSVEARQEGTETETKPKKAGTRLTAGMVLTTAARTKCELLTTDGITLRMNGDSKLQILPDGRFKLLQGQIFALVTDQKLPFELLTPQGMVVASGSEFDLTLTTTQQRLLVLLGSATLVSSSNRYDVLAGQGALLKGVGFERIPQWDTVTATQWIHDLLIQKGRDNPELSRRVNTWLAKLGRDKMAYLQDAEIRALGDHGVVPLIKFLLSDEGKKANSTQIDMATSIIADLAQPASVPDLIDLLEHPTTTVRKHAAMALYRLTRQDQQLTAADWGTADSAKRQAAVAMWRDWYQKQNNSP